MTPSQLAKAAGLKSLSQAAEMTGQSPQTLTNWHKYKPELFTIVLLGCVQSIKEKQPTASHWYCPHCDESLQECHVTFNQRHVYCGNVAKWVELKA